MLSDPYWTARCVRQFRAAKSPFLRPLARLEGGSQTGKDLFGGRHKTERDSDGLQCRSVPSAICAGTAIFDDDGVEIAVAEFTSRLSYAHISHQSGDNNRVYPENPQGLVELRGAKWPASGLLQYQFAWTRRYTVIDPAAWIAEGRVNGRPAHRDVALHPRAVQRFQLNFQLRSA